MRGGIRCPFLSGPRRLLGRGPAEREPPSTAAPVAVASPGSGTDVATPSASVMSCAHPASCTKPPVRRTSAGSVTHAATAAASSWTAPATPSSAARATSAGPWWLARPMRAPRRSSRHSGLRSPLRYGRKTRAGSTGRSRASRSRSPSLACAPDNWPPSPGRSPHCCPRPRPPSGPGDGVAPQPPGRVRGAGRDPSPEGDAGPDRARRDVVAETGRAELGQRPVHAAEHDRESLGQPEGGGGAGPQGRLSGRLPDLRELPRGNPLAARSGASQHQPPLSNTPVNAAVIGSVHRSPVMSSKK